MFEKSKNIHICILRRIAAFSPAILAGISAYYIFLVIIPFFVLGTYKAPYREPAFEIGQYYFAAFGWTALYATLVVRAISIFVPLLWLLGLIDFCISRRWWVVIVLALAQLPIAYVNAGPYAPFIYQWLEFDISR